MQLVHKCAPLTLIAAAVAFVCHGDARRLLRMILKCTATSMVQFCAVWTKAVNLVWGASELTELSDACGRTMHATIS